MSRARVIKGGQPRRLSASRGVARLITARERELEARCAARIAQAEQQAEELLAAARQQAALRAEAEQAEARRQGAALLIEARRSAAALVEQARGDLTRLAVGIAEKILGAELALAPERVVEIVSQVLRAAGPSGRLLARVHPLDLPLLEARWEQLARAAAEGALELRADAGVSRGGCVLETDRGVADGRVEVQLATLQAVLFAEAEEGEPRDGGLEASAHAGAQAEAGELEHELDDELPPDTIVGGLMAVSTAVSAPLTSGEQRGRGPGESDDE